jgi:hypothetical protein
MRRILLAAVTAISLGGCAGTVGTIGTSSTPADRFSAFVAQYCQFVPDLKVVGAILSQFNATISATDAVLSTIATDLCNSQPPKLAAGRHGAAPWVFDGVAIHGKYLQ